MSSGAQETRKKRLFDALKLELMGCKMPGMRTQLSFSARATDALNGHTISSDMKLQFQYTTGN